MVTSEATTCPTCYLQETPANGTPGQSLVINPVMLRSNCPPSASEAQDILESIEKGNTQLQSLEAEIQRLKNTLATLEQRQEDVKDYVSYQRSLLSPIRRIPPEIMGQIFLALQDLLEPICYGDEALENIEIWTVLRVCRFWRDVALSCSELWTRFNIVHQAFSRPSRRDTNIFLRQAVQLTKDCITYSHSRPLHFAFRANEALLEAAQLLATVSLRWSSAAFNNLPVLHALEAKIFSQLPNLYSLDLDGLGKEWDMQTRPLNLFHNAPSLTRLALFQFDRPHTRFHLPWHQITRFTSINLRQFLPILHLMPALVDLTSVEDIIQADETQDRILLPNLKRLEVTSHTPTTSQIFDALRTPELTTLRLFSKRGFSRIYAAAAAQMVRLSGCSLKDLSVSDYAVDSTFLVLAEAPELERLTVTNLLYPSELFSGLEGVLPRLSELVLRKCAPELALVPSLVSFLQGTNLRVPQNECQPHKKIRIGFASPPGVEFVRSWKGATRQLVQDSSIHIEFFDSLDCVYPNFHID